MQSERFLSRSLTLSPHAVDPLSWFIRPFLPITFAVVMAAVGTVFVVATLPDFESPVHQSAALLCFVLACLTIHRPPRLRLGAFRWWHSLLPLALSWLGVAVSAWGASGSDAKSTGGGRRWESPWCWRRSHRSTRRWCSSARAFWELRPVRWPGRWRSRRTTPGRRCRSS